MPEPASLDYAAPSRSDSRTAPRLCVLALWLVYVFAALPQAVVLYRGFWEETFTETGWHELLPGGMAWCPLGALVRWGIGLTAAALFWWPRFQRARLPLAMLVGFHLATVIILHVAAFWDHFLD